MEMNNSCKTTTPDPCCVPLPESTESEKSCEKCGSSEAGHICHLSFPAKPQPLLSTLLFVTDEWTWIVTQNNTLSVDVPWMRWPYNITDTPFDQIKTDLEAFVAQLGSEDKPGPPYLVHGDTQNTLVLENRQLGLSHIETSELASYFGMTDGTQIPFYKPKTYQAKFEQLYPIQFRDADSVNLEVGDTPHTVQRRIGADYAFSLVNSLQSESFQVWRYKIYEK